MANFEKDSGDILSMVSMLERHLIREGKFDSSSKPSLEQVEEALEETEQEIFIWLAAEGYSTDIADYSNLAKQFIAWYVALGVAYRLELSQPGIQSSARGNSRWKVLYQQYIGLKDIIAGSALTRLGVIQTRTARSVLTGVSISDKAELTSDSDAVQPQFTRELMRNPGRASSANTPIQQ